MIHSGITQRQMNARMASIEIRGLHHKFMKHREEKVHPHIEEVAHQSCDAALLAETSIHVPPECNNRYL